MSSLTDVFLRHYREVLGFLSLRTGSRDVAQDCAQDTWIKLAEFKDRTRLNVAHLMPAVFDCLDVSVGA